MATWRGLVTLLMNSENETFNDVISKTITDEELDVEFDDGCGGSEGIPFTLWTHDHVYFPIVYDGREWVASVPRNPCEEKTEHIG